MTDDQRIALIHRDIAESWERAMENVKANPDVYRPDRHKDPIGECRRSLRNVQDIREKYSAGI